MTLTIRNMEHRDSKQVQMIARTSWHATYQGIIPSEIREKFLASAIKNSTNGISAVKRSVKTERF
ncbi:hypothetical protein [Gracilibacillus suaedae]|uniref:hypothetical protein n=1 Tax=Gracilibacillus suaedae TaxID=2820273 RepID=UPI001ABE09CE|nr:hypothetical protein [Gracilibacillus suaedae]